MTSNTYFRGVERALCATAGSTASSKPDAGADSLLGLLPEELEEEILLEVHEAPIPSISSVLKERLRAIRQPLERTVTTDMFLDVEGKEKEKFADCYSAFVASVHKMEECVCNYIKVCSPSDNGN